MDNKQSEIRKRFLTGWQARMSHHEVDDKQIEIRERHLGIGVAWGASLGVAMGAGLGVASGNLAWGIGFGIAIGTGIGIALGAARGSKHPKSAAESSQTNSDGGA